MPKSVVSIRTEWVCCVCSTQKREFQIEFVDGAPKIRVPSGWVLSNGRTYCGEHSPGELKTELAASVEG